MQRRQQMGECWGVIIFAGLVEVVWLEKYLTGCQTKSKVDRLTGWWI